MKTLAAGALVLALSAAVTAQSKINIPFEAYTLPNGLNVVLSIDRTTPTVAVNITCSNRCANPVRPGISFFDPT